MVVIQDSEKIIVFLETKEEWNLRQDEVICKLPQARTIFTQEYSDGYVVQIRGKGILFDEREGIYWWCYNRETVIFHPYYRAIVAPTVFTRWMRKIRKMWKNWRNLD